MLTGLINGIESLSFLSNTSFKLCLENFVLSPSVVASAEAVIISGVVWGQRRPATLAGGDVLVGAPSLCPIRAYRGLLAIFYLRFFSSSHPLPILYRAANSVLCTLFSIIRSNKSDYL